MRVSLFITCLVDQIYPNVGFSMMHLLRRAGCNVDFPQAQTCCGQPAFNSGYPDQARAVAVSLLDAFENAEYVVSPSGSCAGMVKHYYHELFAGDEHNLARAERLIAKTYEMSQFLVNILGIQDIGASCPKKVTFHPSCHGSRLLGARDEALTLLGNVRGIDLVPLPYAQDCCGFGGTFAIKMSGVSGAMVSEKVDHIVECGAEYLVSTDMGCLMNIGGHLKRRGLPIQAMHLAEFLDKFGDRSEPPAAPPRGAPG